MPEMRNGAPDADERQERKAGAPRPDIWLRSKAENEQGAGDLEPAVDMVGGLGHGCALHILAFASVATL